MIKNSLDLVLDEGSHAHGRPPLVAGHQALEGVVEEADLAAHVVGAEDGGPVIDLVAVLIGDIPEGVGVQDGAGLGLAVLLVADLDGVVLTHGDHVGQSGAEQHHKE